MKISVVTVCRNAVATVEDTICSVADQTFPNIEHVIVDGASTDGTIDIIRRYNAVVSEWISEPDDGIYDAMNKGLALATGDIIGFLNSDDVLAGPSVLEQVGRVFMDETLDACFADLVYVDKHDLDKVARYWRSSPFVEGAFSQGWCPAHPTFYARRSVYNSLGRYDTHYKLAADAELMMRYLEKGGIKTIYVPDIWVKMRLGGQTNRNIGNIFLQNKEILEALRSNGLVFSPVRFAVRKIVSRITQRYLKLNAA